jgi:hypothetical protein
VFLTLLLMFVLVTAVLAVFLWAGTLFLQGYIYTEPVKDLHWRAPAAAGALGLFLVIWCALDAADPGQLDTLFSFSNQKISHFKEFKSRTRGSKEAVTFSKKGSTFQNGQSVSWKPVMENRIVESVTVKLEDGEEIDFKARLNAKGNFERREGDRQTLARYEEVGGSRTLTSDDLERRGELTTYLTGALIANWLLNLFHLALWFGCLWVLLNYQWAHALGLAVAIWLAFSIPGSVVHMLLNVSRAAAREGASQKETAWLAPSSQNVHDVAVLHDVRLSFQPVDAVVLGLLHRADFLEVVVANHFRADEALGEIGMNLAGAFNGIRAALQAPGPALVLADREEDDLAHGIIDVAQGRRA